MLHINPSILKEMAKHVPPPPSVSGSSGGGKKPDVSGSSGGGKIPETPLFDINKSKNRPTIE